MAGVHEDKYSFNLFFLNIRGPEHLLVKVHIRKEKEKKGVKQAGCKRKRIKRILRPVEEGGYLKFEDTVVM
ncbi:hypothetical protein VTP01DRAFT_10811 [Rhizomucor pusillus]|uniref:uncharacterized protein n=1 Tax=Rhizomucor pusillus TaxID=4840 RepID=UPI0037433E3B